MEREYSMENNLHSICCNLIRRGFDAVACNNVKEALEFIVTRFPVNKKMLIGMGNSLTLETLNIKNVWRSQVSAIYQHTPTSSHDETRKALTADVYLTSANAITRDGLIVNIDGTGNRTAATCYGPQQIIFVIGRNKITADLPEAIYRARNIAAVQNARRYNRKTPCIITGKCEDCLSPECICSVMTIHRRKPLGVQAIVILVNEDMGL